jgi:hypothetical protein
MNQDPAARRRRATFVIVTLTILLGGGAFLYSLLIGGEWFLAMLVTLGAVALVGGVHYLLWGRTLSREVAARPRVPRGDGRTFPGRGLPQP